jgi:FkbM family methyltransferase
VHRILRAVADTRAAHTVIQTARAARLLRPRRRLVLGQARPGTRGRYEMRCGVGDLAVRHRSRDLDILAEVFSAGAYELPAAVALTGAPRVVDAGGNIGLFGLYAREHWQAATIRSYEPDPENLQLLRANAAGHDGWDVIESAVGNSDEPIRFVVGRYSECCAASEGEPGTSVPCRDLFTEVTDVDLLKLDIEGGEWPILTDPRMCELDARTIVMEWHESGCPDPDPPDFASRLLAQSGFTNQIHLPGRFASNGMLWAWREGPPTS